MKLIDGDVLEKFVKSVRRDLDCKSPDNVTRDLMLLNFEQYIHLQPTINPEDLREKGQWKILIYPMKTLTFRDEIYTYFIGATKCSRCDEIILFNKRAIVADIKQPLSKKRETSLREKDVLARFDLRGKDLFHYCPNCGAKMEVDYA